MAKAIETNIKKKRGLNLDGSLYPNKDGNYSPIVLEIEQIRERGIWANDPLITTAGEIKQKKYQEFFDKFYQMPLLRNFRLFEKRLYRWGWVGLVVRFYGKDKINYTLGFESRRITGISYDLETNEAKSINTVWYFVDQKMEYKVSETWTKTKVTRKLQSVSTIGTIDLEVWNVAHPTKQILDWTHDYGFIPIVPVWNSLGESGQAINGFENALSHIDELDRMTEEIKYETIATRSKTYYSKAAFSKRLPPQNGEIKTQVTSESDILESAIVGLEENQMMMTGGDNLNDKLKASLPILVAQFNRTTLDPLLKQKEDLITEIYTMLGFTNPNQTNVVQRTATEMEYYNENTASTLKNLSLDRTNTLLEFIDLIFQIGINNGYTGFSKDFNIDELRIKVIPNIKTDENLFLDYHLKRYVNKLISLGELKEIIDNIDKEAVKDWIAGNVYSLISQEDVDKLNILKQTQELDHETMLNIFFKQMLAPEELQKIITKAEEEKPAEPTDDMLFGNDFEEENITYDNKNKDE